MRQTLYLLGMMGCGKTTVGRRFAQAWDLEFTDLDAYVEQREGVTVGELFDQGEATFRAAERSAAAALAARLRAERRGGVVALGGGAYLQPEIREIADAGHAVYLQMSGDALLARLGAAERARRPFFDHPKGPFDGALEQSFLELCALRHRVYAQAKHHVDAAREPKVVARAIEELVFGENRSAKRDPKGPP